MNINFRKLKTVLIWTWVIVFFIGLLFNFALCGVSVGLGIFFLTFYHELKKDTKKGFHKDTSGSVK